MFWFGQEKQKFIYFSTALYTIMRVLKTRREIATLSSLTTFQTSLFTPSFVL